MNTLPIIWNLLIHLLEIFIFYLYISTILTVKEYKKLESCFLCIYAVGIYLVLSMTSKHISTYLLTTFTPVQQQEIFLDDSYQILYSSLYIVFLATLSYWCSKITAHILFHISELTCIRQENKQLQERTKLLELETQQYNNLLETTESLRTIKHDVHHHLATIHSLIQSKNQEQLLQYLNEYEQHFNLDYTITTTGNIVIDSILSTKIFHAKQQDIKLDFSIMLPDSIPFSDVALSALLGNLFDNALEACKYLSPEQERWIHFQMKVQEDMLVIHMENIFDGIIKKDKNDTYISRKKEASHGIGLKRIHTLVEEANGFMEIRHNNHIFTVHIMVPLENTNEF